MTQTQLAGAAGISTAAVKAYERDARRPSAQTLARLADALGLGGDEVDELQSLVGVRLRPLWQPAARDAAEVLDELRAHADACSWPAFITNQSFDILYGNDPMVRLLGVDRRHEFRGFAERNILLASLVDRFAAKIENWPEVIAFMIGLAKGEQRWANTEPDRVAPWLQHVSERIGNGDPALVGQLLTLWREAPPIAHRLMHRYAVRWRAGEGVVLRFTGLLVVADPVSELHWSEWIPEDEATWRYFGAILAADQTAGDGLS
jgi:transcriptional regulator with XRE-family HTH domain